MEKTVTLTTRMSPELKQQAEQVFTAIGLSMPEAIRMFLTRVVAEEGLPFEARVPNRETRKAIADAKARRNVKRFKTVDELFADLNS